LKFWRRLDLNSTTSRISSEINNGLLDTWPLSTLSLLKCLLISKPFTQVNIETTVSGGELNTTLMNFQKSKSTIKDLMQSMDPIFLHMLLSNQFPKELKLDIGVSEEKLKSLDFCWAIPNKISKMLSIHHLKNGSKKINFT